MFWTCTATNTGLYQLEYGVANNNNNALSSAALFDAATAIPEPANMLLLGLGLIGLAGVGLPR